MKCTTNAHSITFTFGEGETALPSITFNADQCAALHDAAMMHGFEQKIRDNAAIARKQKDGTVITVTEAMRRAAVEEMVNHLHGNTTWNMKVSQRTAPQNPTILAIAAKRGCTYAEAEAHIAATMLAELSA